MRTTTLEEFGRDFDEIMALVEVGERFMIQRDSVDILRLEPASEPTCPDK